MPPVFGLPSNPRGRGGTAPFPTAAISPKPSVVQPLLRNLGESRPNRSITSSQTRPAQSQIQETQPQRSVRPPAQPSRIIDPYGEEYAPRRSRESDSSSGMSSSGSSIWARDAPSQRSSRTTLQSYDGDNGYIDVLKPPSSDDAATFNVDTGHVWSRVTEAANVITGVGKVLASGLASYSGGDEEEPDNHLTNILRAYHLAKAASPTDLPDWLFTERERRLPGFQQAEAPKTHSESQGRVAQTAEISYRRDIYRTQRSEHTFEQPTEPTYHRESSQTLQTRGFGDRLKDIRKVPGGSSLLSRRQY